MNKTILGTLKLVIVGAFVSALAFGGTQVIRAENRALTPDDCDSVENFCDMESDVCGLCDWLCRKWANHPNGGTCNEEYGCCICFD